MIFVELWVDTRGLNTVVESYLCKDTVLPLLNLLMFYDPVTCHSMMKEKKTTRLKKSVRFNSINQEDVSFEYKFGLNDNNRRR